MAFCSEGDIYTHRVFRGAEGRWNRYLLQGLPTDFLLVEVQDSLGSIYGGTSTHGDNDIRPDLLELLQAFVNACDRGMLADVRERSTEGVMFLQHGFHFLHDVCLQNRSEDLEIANRERRTF